MINKPYVGQAIVCINDKNQGPPVKEGMQYVINAIRTCPVCGMVEFQIPVPFPGFNDGREQICMSCKTPLEEKYNEYWWAEHWRFAEVKQKTESISLESVKLRPKEVIEQVYYSEN